MKHIDITFDLETVGLSVNSGVFQIAALAWERRDPTTSEDPFLVPLTVGTDTTFNCRIDLLSCVFDGFRFEGATLDWWSKASEALKQQLLVEPPVYTMREAFTCFCEWVADIRKIYEADTFCLWCQGSDFDIAILRYVCERYGISLPVSHTEFRDCRTYILEYAYSLYLREGKDTGGLFSDPSAPYRLLPELPKKYIYGEAHDAFSDCVRSTWNVWHAMYP